MTIYQFACFAIADHLARNPDWHVGLADVSTNTKGYKLSAKALLIEAERLLSRISGGLSLLEDLVRNPELREDMVNLLKEIEADSGTYFAPRLLQPGR